MLAEATKQPFTGFLVNAQWIMNLVQADKFSVTSIHIFPVMYVNGPRHIKELQDCDREMEKQAMKDAVAEAERLLGGFLKEQKQYPQSAGILQPVQEAEASLQILGVGWPEPTAGQYWICQVLCGPGMGTLMCSAAVELSLITKPTASDGLM